MPPAPCPPRLSPRRSPPRRRSRPLYTGYSRPRTPSYTRRITPLRRPSPATEPSVSPADILPQSVPSPASDRLPYTPGIGIARGVACSDSAFAAVQAEGPALYPAYNCARPRTRCGVKTLPDPPVGRPLGRAYTRGIARPRPARRLASRKGLYTGYSPADIWGVIQQP